MEHDLSADIDLGRSGRVRAIRSLDPSWRSRLRRGVHLSELLRDAGLSSAAAWLDEQVASDLAEGAFTVVSGGTCLHVLAVTRVDRSTLRLTIRSIDSSAIASLVEARVKAVGSAKRLSAREIEVLAMLVAGHSLVHIAGVLRIKPRTVKFHQSNILDKLGADSRNELLRVVL